MNIGDNISKAIKEKKWLNISYTNTRELYVSIFNDRRAILDTINSWIFFDKIKTAKVIEFTSYDRPDELIEKIEQNMELCQWLNYDHFNNNILNYYIKCNELDVDPVQKEYDSVQGIDLNLLMKNLEYTLNYSQERKIISDIYHYEIRNVSSSHFTLIINRLSIDKVITPQLRFNESFMIEGRPQSIFKYIRMDVDEFTRTFESNQTEYENIISENLWYGEYINTKPEIMLLEREISVDLTDTYFVIEDKYRRKVLPDPLKSFFSSNSKVNNVERKDFSMVIYDEQINIDQVSVIYNSLKYPTTYVKGPPGTGKTQTILNIIMSGFYNDQRILVCSSNNKPVDGIKDKLNNFTYHEETIPFPYIRLGNSDDLKEATKKIKEYYEMSTDISKPEEDLVEIKIMDKKNHEKFLNLLENHERRQELQNRIDCAQNLIQLIENESTFTNIDEIQMKLEKDKEELDKLPIITNRDIVNNYIPFKSNEQVSEYFYYKSYQRINNLKDPIYSSLINVCSIYDDITRVKEFNNWCSEDSNMELLTKVFPIILSTNISSRRLGTPKFMFDTVIMDEAGQCNIATALIPITKAKSLVLVGDPRQLRPVIVLDDSVNKTLMDEFHISENYNYKKNSILDVMLFNDKISKNILLSYHYRCGRKIIKFSNQRYYNNELNLSHLKSDGNLEILDIKNKNVKYRNEAFDEASAIVNYIKRNNIHNVFIPLQERKKKLVIASDTEAIRRLSNQRDDLSNLIKYVKSNGNIVVPPNESILVEIGRSNGSRAEDEFFFTISHFCTCYQKYEVKRNVKLSNLFGNRYNTDMEFDSILYDLSGTDPKPLIAFEINGGEHIGNASRERSDNRKMKICSENNIKLIFIPNKMVKSYITIMDLIFKP
ncbi:P-loop containing nucleoside triphosphate hydrolase protein [Neocallimastix californiae]|uniref:p-loop containing nucleoside triphosphate hydrolase protein n=1 Tax=Neocallimastix californiae TaxID=1754190 RepID=A0A1Y2FDK5_9FUNG|nr:P-loop containing nucleoside triphosphate hydrolase protein [Neocallimastix californiae]|eukprot:ORY81687.1 P-loop containing nucleoside triphosphate hydrolase protein [Neocallimastix californiae]